jgi:hypothetical protein
MNDFSKPIPRLLMLIGLCFIIFYQSSCKDSSSTLTFDDSSTVNIEIVFPNTPTGNMIREHLRISMGSGMDAESKYQKSLITLRAEPKAAQVLFDGYKKVAPENYFYRNMIVEALKEIRSVGSLEYLNEIAIEKIPADQEPENAEIDTRLDEIMIRITAVEGITLLAADSLVDAERILSQLISHDNLTVRQMAVRGYLQTQFGSKTEKMQELRNRLPEEEHWYITSDVTNIKKVVHPEMPEKFDLKTKETKDSPKIKEQ